MRRRYHAHAADIFRPFSFPPIAIAGRRDARFRDFAPRRVVWVLFHHGTKGKRCRSACTIASFSQHSFQHQNCTRRSPRDERSLCTWIVDDRGTSGEARRGRTNTGRMQRTTVDRCPLLLLRNCMAWNRDLAATYAGDACLVHQNSDVTISTPPMLSCGRVRSRRRTLFVRPGSRRKRRRAPSLVCVTSVCMCLGDPPFLRR